MGYSPDLKLTDETLEYIMMKARDQDVIYFFGGLCHNKDRRILVEFLKKNYDTVRVISKVNVFGGANRWRLQLQKRFEGNFMLRYLVEYTFTGLSAEKDYKDIVEFFKDKDTSKYSQALAQALESIRSKIAWIGVC